MWYDLIPVFGGDYCTYGGKGVKRGLTDYLVLYNRWVDLIDGDAVYREVDCKVIDVRRWESSTLVNLMGMYLLKYRFFL